MTKQEAVNYYHSLLKFGIRPGLQRIEKLTKLLGQPQEGLSFIHIAGTNGKGSTAIMLSEIFNAAGYQTGLFISPYITDFCERIQIGGAPVSDGTLINATQRVKNAIEALGEEITEFEAVTAAAFLCYKESGCDIVILETGLGGRFDATNIIDSPEISVITSISLDHTNILGDTLRKIAFEKAGIIKPCRPAVIPSTLPEDAMQVFFDVCDERASPLYIADMNEVCVCGESLRGFRENFAGLDFFVPLPGKVQAQNAALAVTAARLCKKFPVTDAHIVRGIGNTVNPARCELLCESPVVILDGCHNDASTKALSSLLEEHLRGKKILALMGMMADKEIDKALRNLLPHFALTVTATPSNPRAIGAGALAQMIREKGGKAEEADDPAGAVERCFALLPGYDALVVCGSLYLAGDVRNILIKSVDALKKR
ncbi:MAG: bifunctional folylpolyglutamate synthase/dihydrofolate synthase [Clostridia bacterium]|nr:bifunctional folylpolyglutamate synthase/dihydrofolate synthase [Clostridia bacterium]